MKKLVCNLYSFEELSDDAKEAVCDEERSRDYNYGYLAQESDAQERISTLDKFCEVFGIKYHIDYDHCHRFITWNFVYWDSSKSPDEIRGKYLWRFLDKYYYDIRSRKYYGKLIPHEIDSEHRAGWEHVKRHSKIIWEDRSCPFTGVCYDGDILDKIYDWYKNPDWKISLRDLLDNCFHHFLEYWKLEDDYRMSDEYIGEAISVNWPDKLYFGDGTEFTGDYNDCVDYIEEGAA